MSHTAIFKLLFGARPALLNMQDSALSLCVCYKICSISVFSFQWNKHFLLCQEYQVIEIPVLIFKNALSSQLLLGSLLLKTSINNIIRAVTSYLQFCQALLHSKALDSFHYYPTFPFVLELFSRMHDIHIKLIANTEHVYSITINQTFFLCMSSLLILVWYIKTCISGKVQ